MFEQIKQVFGIEKRAKPATYGGLVDSSYTLSQFTTFFNSLFSTSGQSVTDETAQKLSAFYSCVRNISEDIAKVQFHVVSVDADDNKKTVKHIATTLFNKIPSNLSTPFVFRSTLIRNALLYGNGYAYLVRDKSTGAVAEMFLINPLNVVVQVVDRTLFYIVTDARAGIVGTFGENDIFHIRCMGDGYVGKSIVQYGAESLGANLAAQTFAASFFGNGATLTGTLEVPGVIKDETQAANIVNTFKKSYKTDNGSNNGVALLHSGAKFSKIQSQPNEAQMLETREFGTQDIARWFRMPLSKLQSGTSGSSNVEQLNIEYVTDCLMPWFVKLEQEIERKIFRFDEMDSLDAKFKVNQLMRGDMASTSAYLRELKYAGFITTNEGRKMVDMNTIKDEFADQVYSPVNMIPSTLEDNFWSAKDQSQTSHKEAGQGGTN